MESRPIPYTNVSSVMLDLNQLQDDQSFDEPVDQPVMYGERYNDWQADPFLSQSSDSELICERAKSMNDTLISPR